MIKKYKGSLIEPLKEKELHIFHANSDIAELIKSFTRVLRDEVHGCYLLGGFRGAGKTSFVNLCCVSVGNRKLVRIQLDCSKLVNVSNFLFFFVEALAEETSGLKLPAAVHSEIQTLREKVAFKSLNKKMQIAINKEIGNQSQEELSAEKLSINFSILNKLLGFMKSGERHAKTRNEENRSLESSELFEVEARNDEFILIEHLSKVLCHISEEGYQIVNVIDEIDKQTHTFLEDLFGVYKNLFLNSHMTTVFVVDQNKYQDIVFREEVDDNLRVYFTGCFYLPTFGFEDIKGYMYREFQVTSKWECLKAAYLSNGAMRKINTYSYMDGYQDSYLLQKASLWQDILSETERKLIRHHHHAYVKDKLKVIVKDTIERLFYTGSIERSKLTDALQDKFYKHNLPVDAVDIIRCMEQIATKNPSLIVIYNDINDKTYIKVNPKDSIEAYRDSDGSTMTFQLNSWDIEDINRTFIKSQSDPIPIVERDTQGFEHFIRIIETNIRSIKNIIIIKKFSNWDQSEVYTYSAILIMDKPVGNVVYVVEECSFSYEGPFTVELLTDFMSKHKIPRIVIEMDDEPILEHLDYIYDEVDKKIYPR